MAYKSAGLVIGRRSRDSARVRNPIPKAVLAIALLAGAPATARAVTAAAAPALPYLDVRADAAPTGAPAIPGAAAARGALRRALGRGASIDVDPVTGTALRIAKAGGTLTGLRSSDRVGATERYIRENAGAIGLAPADLDSLVLDRRLSAPGGALYLRWRQQAGSIPVFQGDLRATVAPDGRLVSLQGAPVRGVAEADTRPRLDAAEAVRRAYRDAGAPLRPGDASLVLYRTESALRLAWAVTVDAGTQTVYLTLVDAGSGAILHRQDLVSEAAPALAWGKFPGASAGGSQAAVDLEARGWMNSGAANLTGPFAHTYSDVNDNNAAAASEEVNRTGGGFSFAFTPFAQAAGACTDGPQCSWDFDAPTSWQTNRQQDAVQAFVYVNAFHDHLAAAPIGFSAADGAFENSDPLILETDDGAGITDGSHRDNANMFTPPDGQAPRMQMYLFYKNGTVSPFRDVNGGDDAAIVYHEYTHGLSSRLVTFGDGSQALGTAQSGAMSEAWSDFYAKDMLVNQGLETDTTAPGEVDMGEYVDSVPHSIRSQALDCPVGAPGSVCPGHGTAGPGGYTYGDFGRIKPGAEVHYDGEIWGETLWDLRNELGAPVAETLVTDGMRGSNASPSFLDERNAILDADVARSGGHHQAALWRVFSARGMGTDASSASSTTTSPTEGFARPADAAPSASLSAPASVATGAPAHLDASASQDADGVIREYRWDFDGNGSVDRTTSGPATDFSYPAPGSFATTVTVVDDGQNTAGTSRTIQVTAPAAASTPTPGPSAAAGPGAAPKAGATTPLATLIAPGRITVDRRGRFGIRVNFAARAPSGTAKVSVLSGRTRLGGASLRVTKDSSVQVRVRLTRTGLRALRRRRLKVTLKLALPGGGSATKTVQLRIGAQ